MQTAAVFGSLRHPHDRWRYYMPLFLLPFLWFCSCMPVSGKIRIVGHQSSLHSFSPAAAAALAAAASA